MDQDLEFMRIALAEARSAYEASEVPVGAVVVVGDSVISRGHNLRETTKDPTAHAEIVAIRKASEVMGTWRLSDATVYVTMEPCPMCAGAMILARLSRLVYGTPDPKAGAAGTVYDILRDSRLNHWTNVRGGVLEQECAELLSDFFRERRFRA